ncbi:MAG: Ig-like domain-containing protein, partial [Gemmatimonadaceae bacterium]
MQKVSRSIFTGLLVIAGLTACGDKVTVAPGNSSSAAAPAVHSVTVTPPSASVSVGQSVQLVASVNADATLARTVTWATTAASIATVSASGLVTAVGPGTVAITAASTADPTVVGAATIIVAPIQLATISISTINKGGLPANLNGVTGQLDVTLNVDQGTQTVTALNLIVHNNTTNTDTTVATYSFTSPQKVPASGANATSAPITMSFNTAAFNATTGAVSFVNGSYTIRAQAVVAGTSQTPVTSTINYTVANADFINVAAKGDTSATGPVFNGSTTWQGGKVNVTVVPVLYSGVTLKSVTVSPDPAFTNTLAQTVTTYPTTVSFAVGKDTLTKGAYQATVTSTYSTGATGPGVLPNAMNVDNQAPAPPTLNQLKGGLSRWLPASYAFGANAADYTAGADAGFPTNPGVGVGAVQFWVWPKAAFTALGGTKSGANCKTTGGQMVTSASALAQSAPADSTTYDMRALQFDKLGNVVCSDLTATG